LPILEGYPARHYLSEMSLPRTGSVDGKGGVQTPSDSWTKDLYARRRFACGSLAVRSCGDAQAPLCLLHSWRNRSWTIMSVITRQNCPLRACTQTVRHLSPHSHVLFSIAVPCPPGAERFGLGLRQNPVPVRVVRSLPSRERQVADGPAAKNPLRVCSEGSPNRPATPIFRVDGGRSKKFC
jgi:hypothetical protein